MNQVLQPFIDQLVLVYLDDEPIFSKTAEEHTVHLEKVSSNLLENKAYFNVNKCSFFQTSARFLGYVVTLQGLCPDERLVSKVVEFVTPSNKT